MKEHLITRQIGIDAGHRVTYHGSKCRNLHGHRYEIHATCAGPLFEAGEQQGMVLDFGFLKEEMMSEIDAPCDHGMILWVDDPLLPDFMIFETKSNRADAIYTMDDLRAIIPVYYGAWPIRGKIGKMYIVPFVPTAENLARHWFERLAKRVKARSDGMARLVNIKVWETPNCSAEYPGLSTPSDPGIHVRMHHGTGLASR
jgi:6-pyruvoyltetrahydropterin/6-carboxytetrahydropterin synthase